jgi:hypothetical protein
MAIKATNGITNKKSKYINFFVSKSQSLPPYPVLQWQLLGDMHTPCPEHTLLDVSLTPKQVIN